jgi:hypothetical protein
VTIGGVVINTIAVFERHEDNSIQNGLCGKRAVVYFDNHDRAMVLQVLLSSIKFQFSIGNDYFMLNISDYCTPELNVIYSRSEMVVLPSVWSSAA